MTLRFAVAPAPLRFRLRFRLLVNASSSAPAAALDRSALAVARLGGAPGAGMILPWLEAFFALPFRLLLRATCQAEALGKVGTG